MKDIPPEKMKFARYLYEFTNTRVADIAEMLGLNDCAFRKRMRDNEWKRRRASQPDFAFARACLER